MTLSPSSLEREFALLVWHLRTRRMSRKEFAVHSASLVGKKPIYTLESRVDDLIEELRLW